MFVVFKVFQGLDIFMKQKKQICLSSIDQIKLMKLISLNILIWLISYYNLDFFSIVGLEII